MDDLFCGYVDSEAAAATILSSTLIHSAADLR